MPRPRKESLLDHQIVSLAAQFGSAIANAVRASLAAEVAKVLGARRAGGATARPAGPRKRADGQAVQKKLLSVLSSKNGLATGEIVSKAGFPRGAIEYHLRALRSKKKVRVVGNRGAARWFSA